MSKEFQPIELIVSTFVGPQFMIRTVQYSHINDDSIFKFYVLNWFGKDVFEI